MFGEHNFFWVMLADFFADFKKIKADFLKSSKIELETFSYFQSMKICNVYSKVSTDFRKNQNWLTYGWFCE